jgi:hypothetical protein
MSEHATPPRKTRSLAKIYAKIHAISIEKLHKLAKRCGMQNYRKLNKSDLCYKLSVLIGIELQINRTHGTKLREILKRPVAINVTDKIAEAAIEIIDPITNSIMINPIVVSSGVHCDRASLQALFENTTEYLCPVTKKQLDPLAYADVAMRDRIVDVLKKHGLDMDIERDSIDNTSVVLWVENRIKEIALFFNYAIARRVRESEYLHPVTVFNPKGWRMLWYITSCNIKFNLLLQSQSDRRKHEQVYAEKMIDIISKVYSIDDNPQSDFNRNKAKLERYVRQKKLDFVFAVKYLNDNYTMEKNSSPSSAGVFHAFASYLGFGGMDKLDGYEKYQDSELRDKPPGLYGLNFDTSDQASYFESNPLFV